MKPLKVILIIATIIAGSTIAFLLLRGKHSKQKTGFNGVWAVDSPIEVNNLLEINGDTTEFNVAENQLWLKCRNVYNKDTLLLYVTSIDCGREFQGPPYYNPPKVNSLFAKCYIRDDGLFISYAQKLFREHIKDLQLATKAYRNSDDDKK